MSWTKLGQVYVADRRHRWASSHAYVPTPLLLDNDRVRVYAAFRDPDGIGRVGYVEVDGSDPTRVLEVSEQPVLDIGEPGTFDDSGVTPVSLVRAGADIYMYYIGWQKGVRVPYFLFTGLAISTDGGRSFRRFSRVPILDRCDQELMLRSAAHVQLDQEKWRMWYIAGSDWTSVGDKQLPVYNIRYLESVNGRSWGTDSRVCIDLEGPDEFGFGRPFVLKQADKYQMWYSIRRRSSGYRIGYAESDDGVSWQRADHRAGIDVSSSGWDSEMVAFASVVESRHGQYMFYNGNNYGETGFGVAVRGTSAEA